MPGTRFLSALDNLDPCADDPQGVPVGGVIYGGRDSDTWVPVEQSFDWAHGTITKGASLESETTAATLGQAGERKFNVMSNLDFLSLPLGRYIQNHLDFVAGVESPPSIFSVNYFQKDENGKYLTGMLDKKVWVKWMELRANGDVEAIRTPTGFIPLYDDLAPLFKDLLGEEYTKEAYVKQFTLRIPKSLEKIERIEGIYKAEQGDVPPAVFEVLGQQRQRLVEAQAKHGDEVSPFVLQEEGA